MTFFNSLGKKLSQTGQEVVQKTKDTAEVIKYNSMISDEEYRIDNLYKQIGKTYAELHAESCDEIFRENIAAIKDAQSKIAEYREHIKQVKGIFACPNCGEELQRDVQFCSACGSKIEKQETSVVAEKEVVKYCQNCNAPMQEGYVFCINCGTKNEEETERGNEP